jgi:hypothetical protein
MCREVLYQFGVMQIFNARWKPEKDCSQHHCRRVSEAKENVLWR